MELGICSLNLAVNFLYFKNLINLSNTFQIQQLEFA